VTSTEQRAAACASPCSAREAVDEPRAARLEQLVEEARGQALADQLLEVVDQRGQRALDRRQVRRERRGGVEVEQALGEVGGDRVDQRGEVGLEPRQLVAELGDLLLDLLASFSAA
jgi:hypothetical protein